MSWKQPIPTNVLELTEGDKFLALLFILLVYRAANKDLTHYTEKGQAVKLRRGQIFCKRAELVDWFGMKKGSSLKIQRGLEKLEKVNNLVNKRKVRDGTIVTIKNYDELISFEQPNEQTVNKPRTNNNSTKSEKSVKSELTKKNVNVIENFSEDAIFLAQTLKDARSIKFYQKLAIQAKKDEQLRSDIDFCLGAVLQAIRSSEVDNTSKINNAGALFTSKLKEIRADREIKPLRKNHKNSIRKIRADLLKSLKFDR